MVSNRPANTRTYEATIHWSPNADAPRSCWTVGMATLRIVVSTAMRTRLMDRTAGVYHRSRCVRDWFVSRAGESSILSSFLFDLDFNLPRTLWGLTSSAPPLLGLSCYD